jgi:SPP1 family predicted phage head-tail adaptor
MSNNPFLITLLRHRITLEAAQRTGDGAGGAAVTWEPVADVWASIRPLTGGEAVIADGTRGRITHEIWLRRRDVIAPHMRFRQSERIFEIRAVIDVDERRRRFRCLCEERDL